MNLNHLEYFQCLAEFQHYAQAADKLHISQSNLSYAITSLENELGIKLFEKRGRNVTLTDNGIIFLKYVNRALNELNTGRLVVRERTAEEVRVVRVSAFRIHSLSEILQEFYQQKEYEGIRVEVSHQKTVDIIQSLKNHKIEIGLCSYPIVDHTLDFLPALQQRIVVLLPNDHPLATREYVDLTEIADLPIIIPHGSDGMRSRIVSLFTLIGVCPQFACEADSSNAAAHLVSIKQGIALTVDNPMLHNSKISIVPLRHPPHTFYTYLVTKKGNLSASACKLKDYILGKQLAYQMVPPYENNL